MITGKGDPPRSWTAKCYYCRHNKDDSKTWCNRSASFKPNDDADRLHALLYLKDWCLRAKEAASRKDHQSYDDKFPKRDPEAPYPAESVLDDAINAKYTHDGDLIG